MLHRIFRKDVPTKRPFIELQVLTPGQVINAGWTQIATFQHAEDHASEGEYAPDHPLYLHVRDELYKLGITNMQHVIINPDLPTPPATITFAATATGAVGATVDVAMTTTPTGMDDWEGFYTEVANPAFVDAAVVQSKIVLTMKAAGVTTVVVKHRRTPALTRTVTVTVTAAP